MNPTPADFKRMKEVTIVKPIVYGTVAWHMPAEPEVGLGLHSHQWTVYVKPYDNEDMSSYVREVHFKLHQTYKDRNRVCLKPPYEVTETGWGEFMIIIMIFFNDPNERPVTLYHELQLLLSGTEPKLVVESYEELIFRKPTVFMHKLLTNTRPITTGPWVHETNFEEKKKKTVESLVKAKATVRDQINELKEKLKNIQEEAEKFHAEVHESKADSSE